LRILAIETNGACGSVAALADCNVLAELRLNPAQRGAQALAPGLAEVLREAGWKPRDVQLAAVSIGPGSFTALRVGVTTAKTFAYAVAAEVLTVNTLEAIAAQVAEAATGDTIATAIDAQRGDVYAALFRRRAPFDVECVEPAAIRPADEWIAGLLADTLVGGPALETLAARLPGGVRVAPRDAWLPMAATVGRLAAAKYAAGQRDNLWGLAPLYLRKSAAEERVTEGKRDGGKEGRRDGDIGKA